MNAKDIAQIKALLSTPKHIVIIPHKNPDGDAIGSTSALFLFLKKKGHLPVVIAPNDYPHFLKWMAAEEAILKYDQHKDIADQKVKEASIIFTLDFNDLGRIGELQAVVQDSEATFIMIDHHQQPEDYADYMYSDTSIGSTCEMVYNFFSWLGEVDAIDADIANCLYTGIMTDTGSFRFPSTTSTTHRVVADLIDKGANNASVHQMIYDTNSLSKLQLLGCALRNLVTLDEFSTAYITLSQKELDQHNFKKGDTEGFVNYGLSLKGINFAVIFIENRQENIIKISLRSKGDFSVNQFARKYFEGGGHDNAAGGKSDRNMQRTIEYFVNLLPQYKEALNNS
ncbi:bifunctional oligoribonuclease/PAP phosphatase NrnA [Sungkyunkwania multivorans]|uniref:Bifunctional oligoribonuclease/PAP phosphatase NrnA n=1 Tax=Sungkyunkwania multivorans TaxID=1173618 RepID=A0ABW3CXA5_9FLAO